jgi:hypothetical protein
MEKVKHTSILSLIIFFVAGCSPFYNLPMEQNVKVFEEKGDMSASLNVGPFLFSAGGDFSYAVTDNIGFVSGLDLMNISASNTSPFRDFHLENEIVFFRKFRKEEFSGQYAAFNIGHGFAGYNLGNPYFRLNMNRFFLQPSYGVKIFKRSNITFSARLNAVIYNLNMFTEGKTETQINLTKQYFHLDLLDKNKLLVETAFTYHYNAKNGDVISYQFISPLDNFPVILLTISYRKYFNK